MIARLALAEGGISWEPVFVDIHARMNQQRPDYVQLNPNMTVPTLVLADRILGESRDIAQYALGVNSRTTLMPPADGIADTVSTMFLARMEFAGLGAELSRQAALAR